MTARDIISPMVSAEIAGKPLATVDSSLPAIDVLPRLLDALERRLGVTERGELIGVIDTDSLLAGFARMFPARDDCSIVEVECSPGDYSAAILTHAAEDADVHVVGLWTVPAENGKVRVTLRLRCEDPVHVVRNIERYGFEVVAIHANTDTVLEMAARRFEELQLYLKM